MSVSAGLCTDEPHGRLDFLNLVLSTLALVIGGIVLDCAMLHLLGCMLVKFALHPVVAIFGPLPITGITKP